MKAQQHTTNFAARPRKKVNIYIVELLAVAMALRVLAIDVQHRQITVLSSNLSALQAIEKPKHQSGQYILKEIYSSVNKLKRKGNRVATA